MEAVSISTGQFAPVVVPPDATEADVARVRGKAIDAQFIDNWAGLAQAFGMDPILGRIHATVYLSAAPLNQRQIARALALEVQECQRHLDELCSWGVIELQASGYEAEQDPWTWFMVTVRQRAKREFAPLLTAMRRVEQLSRAQGRGEQAARIARFTRFMEQMAGLVETFGSLGAGPMCSVMRMAARFVPKG